MPTVSLERIPFAEAIQEPGLLGRRWAELSFEQHVMLKAVYGLPLSGKLTNERGQSELEIWAATQGVGGFDEVGFLVDASDDVPYTPEAFSEAWIIGGRRLGKSDAFSSTIVVYEALLGGHERFLRPGQRGICFLICQDLRTARYTMHFVRATLEGSQILRKEIDVITADRIDLKNGMSIYCVPPTLKSVRGYASPVAVLDEVGVWYQEAESANPDYEIYRAITPGQIQFPDKKIVGISSPWNKAGLLYKYWEAGTRGWRLASEARQSEFEGVLVLHVPTALSGNPLVTRDYLEKEKARDPQAFEREFLAKFQDSISGFLPPALVARAVHSGLAERPPQPNKYRYIAAIDPAFRRDAFGFTLVHRDEQGRIVQDLVRRWVGSGKRPLNPSLVLEEIAPICAAYHVKVVYSDQYHLESLQQLARQCGLELMGVNFTAKSKAQIYGNLQQLFYQSRIILLDHPETLRELRQLERTVTQGGQVQIAAPVGQHDDMATIVALASSQAMHMAPREAVGSQKEPTGDARLRERIEDQIRRKWEGPAPDAGVWD